MVIHHVLFLGGTVGANRWRENMVIPGLVARGVAPSLMFNPVVEHWTKEAQLLEDEIKRSASHMLYVIASPDPSSSTGNVSGYSLVELVMSLYDAPERTVAFFDLTGMARHTTKAMHKAVQDLRARFPQSPIFEEDYTALLDWLAARLLEKQPIFS